MMDTNRRCAWCNLKNPRYVAYHDGEWCRPHTDDTYLYEMLVLECFQAGLSFECVLNKRESFRTAYDGFDIDKVCTYGEEKIAELLENKGIIRHRLKILASIQNSRVFKAISAEFGSFYAYIKTFVGDDVIYETSKTKSALSDALAKDLKKRGMTFLGSTIIYSYLQATGFIYAHENGCFLHKSHA